MGRRTGSMARILLALAMGTAAAPALAQGQPDPFLGVAPPPRPAAPPPARSSPATPAPQPAAPAPPTVPPAASGMASPPPRAAPRVPPATAHLPAQWSFRCPAAGTEVTYSDGATYRVLGPDPADPLICQAMGGGGRPFGLVVAAFEAGAGQARFAEALRGMIPRGIGATARVFVPGAGAEYANMMFESVLTIERFETITGAFGRADVVVLSRRLSGTGGNWHRSVLRYFIDRRTGVMLRREVELIAGSTTARSREAVRVTLGAGQR